MTYNIKQVINLVDDDSATQIKNVDKSSNTDHLRPKRKRLKNASKKFKYGVFKSDFLVSSEDCEPASGVGIESVSIINRCNDRRDVMIEYDRIIGDVYDSPNTSTETNCMRIKTDPSGDSHCYPCLPEIRGDETVQKQI